jgi:diol dehydratase reactivase alpha subunit
MPLIAGVDAGNRTTEVAIAYYKDGGLSFLSSDFVETTGIKGTFQNAEGIKNALLSATEKTDYILEDLDVICINEATPVIGDLSMSTVTETIITESAMIGHNPTTPGGLGIGCGKTVRFGDLLNCPTSEKVIIVISQDVSFDKAAHTINRAFKKKIDVQGAIVQNNDGVLISNRLDRVIPIIDEVIQIEDVPIGMPAVVEVAALGKTITELCNPYGIATRLGLNGEQTKKIAPIAISLIGNKSAVVIKTPQGGIRERKIPAGRLIIIGRKYTFEIDVTSGVEQIMLAIEKAGPLTDVGGESGTTVGGMLSRIKQILSGISSQTLENIKVRDLFAADTVVPQKVKGGIAGEYSLNKAIGLAAMVWTDKSLMQGLVDRLQADLNISALISGTEVNMALLGALTTPGVEKPLVVLDMGAGSIDAGRWDQKGNIQSVHLAGAGDMVTMLINSELDLKDPSLAEDIKIYPAAKVESLFHIRLEDGSMKFFKDPLSSNLFGKVVLLKEGGEMAPITQEVSLKKLATIRQNAKKKVFVPNVIRALKRILPDRNLRTIDEIVLLGGCALDFEIPGFISDMLLKNYGVVVGRGNVRGELGPRNAVATGLILSFYNKIGGKIL